jgi:hypothetical protein
VSRYDFASLGVLTVSLSVSKNLWSWKQCACRCSMKKSDAKRPRKTRKRRTRKKAKRRRGYANRQAAQTPLYNLHPGEDRWIKADRAQRRQLFQSLDLAQAPPLQLSLQTRRFQGLESGAVPGVSSSRCLPCKGTILQQV